MNKINMISTKILEISLLYIYTFIETLILGKCEKYDYKTLIYLSKYLRSVSNPIR